jgi:hypothetical protein
MNTETELSWFVDEVTKLDQNDRGQLLDQLRAEQARYIGDRCYCSLLQSPIVVPCKLKKCGFNIDNKEILNCGLYHRGRSKRPRIDVAKTLKITEEQATLEIGSSLCKLQRASLAETIAQKRINRYFMIPADICVNCGGPTTPNAQFTAGKFKYCSRTCSHERPPMLVRLEYIFKTDLRNVLLVSRTLFGSVLVISRVLGIPRTLLIKFYERYLGVKAHEFGADVADLIDLLRKQTPSPSIADFIVIKQTALRSNPRWVEIERVGNSIIKNL